MTDYKNRIFLLIWCWFFNGIPYFKKYVKMRNCNAIDIMHGRDRMDDSILATYKCIFNLYLLSLNPPFFILSRCARYNPCHKVCQLLVKWRWLHLDYTSFIHF